MKTNLIFLFVLFYFGTQSQTPVDLKSFNKRSGTSVSVDKNNLDLRWPVSKTEKGRIVLNLEKSAALIRSLSVSEKGKFKEISTDLNPAFVLTVGKRDLISQNGWNIFFDKTSTGPQQAYTVTMDKTAASVRTEGSRTVVSISSLKAGDFTGTLEITMYRGSPLINIAAVMSTEKDSTAIIYDAGLVQSSPGWKNIAWSDTENNLRSAVPNPADTGKPVAVKYRTILGEGKEGTLAIFPAPHQYFYPLDEAFNLKFTWYGTNYRKLIPEYGIGIRQDLLGDKRWVPWFNAPPQTKQRLNFFCLLSAGTAQATLDEVKRFTNNDTYKPLAGYKTMSSHFHNEFVMKVIVPNKPWPDTPNFKKVFKETGIDIIHLGEFHYTAHPKGPDELRLLEMKYMFEMCKKYSDNEFLLLPGEEPNEFFGGHWLQFFPNEVYWIMSRNENKPFVSEHPVYGKVYRIGNKDEMLRLLELENGLAWTAHARTKGSTGYPDKYREEEFFKSDHFFGAAWKPIPADLSAPRLGQRILDLMDDMANWGHKKYAIAEADLFTVEPENEMYAHLNVNYLEMDALPDYKDGWPAVLNAMRNGKFFVSTGEVLIPAFTVDGTKSGDTLTLKPGKKSMVNVNLDWTFPLSFAEIITGDGKQVFRERIELNNTEAFGKKDFSFPVNLEGKKWVRFEVWDAAVNGAFTQFVWLNGGSSN